ncbi:MAG: DUF3883 domain-containing protein [Flavobacteriaceae bacterium]|jgi:hypothetical protein|nr:DUF3883 domain-containing protein [Flavobacteriaceae bacterium]
MDLEYCDHKKELRTSFLEDLHHSQAGTGRHRCATCAYYMGYDLGCSGMYEDYDSFLSLYTEKEQCRDKSSVVPTKFLSLLGGNQGGSGRHKCCNCAFIAGFNHGLSLKNDAVDVSIDKITFKLNEHSIPVFKNDNDSNTSYRNETTSIVKDFDFISHSNHLKVIGEMGEEIVFKYLNQLPHIITLGKKVEHLSKELGDGLGYDILSYDEQGKELFIEVKTTVKARQEEPFYISANEYRFLHTTPNSVIYRVYNLNVNNRTADFFVLTHEKIKQLKYLPSIYRVII